MDDLISRQAAVRWVKTECNPYGKPTIDFESGKKFIEHLEQMPSAQPEIIRCKDCRWWDKYGDFDIGYCVAARHGYYSEHWEINIRRTYKEDFYCADAEPKGEQE